MKNIIRFFTYASQEVPNASSKYVVCGNPVIINKNEIYDFDEVMPSEIRSFPKRRRPIEMDFRFDSDDLKPINSGSASSPPIPAPPSVLYKLTEKSESIHNKQGRPIPSPPPYPMKQPIKRVTAPAPAPKSSSFLRPSNIRIPSPFDYDSTSLLNGLPLPPHYKYIPLDNPERRRFTTPAPPSMLPDHVITKAPPREQRRDMIASIRDHKGEAQLGEEGRTKGDRRRNSYNALKKYVPRRPSQSATDLEGNQLEGEASSKNEDNEEKSGLPSFIEHVLNKRNPHRGAQSAINPSSSSFTPIPNPGENSEGNSNNNQNQLQDLLVALGPDKLDQLRQLLTSPSGSGPNDKVGPPVGKANQVTARSKRRGGQSFRSKRSINPNYRKQENKFTRVSNKKELAPSHYHKREHNETCNFQFKKGFNCKRLVFKLENWIDQVRDCEKEFVQISDGINVKRICGEEELYDTIHLDGARVSITHYKSDVRFKDTMSFSGIIKCE
ncbi:unnamed protein product [Orchesella dallaii]|uniref:Uncharacterized protein n=1 Tax=Orchesella dallaii TaxID=48710 RepID=A0ABP1PL63_9HEXA